MIGCSRSDRLELSERVVRDRRRSRGKLVLPTRRRRRLAPLMPAQFRLLLPSLRLLVGHLRGRSGRRTATVAARLDRVRAGLDVEERAAAGGERAGKDRRHCCGWEEA